MSKKNFKNLLIRARNISDSHFVIILLVSVCILMGIEAISFRIFRDDPEKDFLITTDQDDYLIYTIDHHLYFYNPVEDSHIPILPDWYIETWYRFSINKEDRLAFSSSHDGGNNIYILDYPFVDRAPQNITQNNFTDFYVGSWSLDGHHLVFKSVHDDSEIISIWDGNSIFDIYYAQGRVSQYAWSPDGRLAFTEFYGFSSLDEIEDDSEIFIWDGDKTINFSQNPSGQDRNPAWNADGQLAFLSEREGKHNIYIWDGVSEMNGQSDMTTIINVAPNRTYYSSTPVWTNSGSLTFDGGGTIDSHLQIYEWNGRSVKNISKNYFIHNVAQAWRSDGYWAFVTGVPGEYINIRDNKNRTIFTTEGQSPPAWGQSGRLIFCVPGRPGWRLSMWDGTKAVEIVQGGDIDAQWRNGESVFCSSG